MTNEDIYAFLTRNPICYLATTAGNQPHVRGMMLYRADANGIIFHTGEGKEMVAQLRQNPAVEICSYNQQENLQVRVCGKAEFFDDLALKQEIVAHYPFMQPMIDKFGYEGFLLFRIVNGSALCWTMGSDMAPKEPIAL